MCPSYLEKEEFIFYPSTKSIRKIFGGGVGLEMQTHMKMPSLGMHQGTFCRIFNLFHSSMENFISFLNNIAFWWAWPAVFITDGSSFVAEKVPAFQSLKSFLHYPESLPLFIVERKGVGNSSLLYIFSYITLHGWWIACFFSVCTHIYIYIKEHISLPCLNTYVMMALLKKNKLYYSGLGL